MRHSDDTITDALQASQNALEKSNDPMIAPDINSTLLALAFLIDQPRGTLENSIAVRRLS